MVLENKFSSLLHEAAVASSNTHSYSKYSFLLGSHNFNLRMGLATSLELHKEGDPYATMWLALNLLSYCLIISKEISHFSTVLHELPEFLVVGSELIRQYGYVTACKLTITEFDQLCSMVKTEDLSIPLSYLLDEWKKELYHYYGFLCHKDDYVDYQHYLSKHPLEF